MFGSGMLKSHGGFAALTAVFAPLLTTLSDAYGNVAEAISVAGRTVTQYDGTIVSVPSTLHSFIGGRLSGGSWFATDTSGAPLHPTQQFMGASVAKFVPKLARSKVYAVGDKVYAYGQWLECVKAGTSSATAPAASVMPAVGSPELVTNGGFDSAAGWTLGAGWSIAAGHASFLYQGSNWSALHQQPLVAGADYIFSMDVLSITGFVDMYLGVSGGAPNLLISSPGTKNLIGAASGARAIVRGRNSASSTSIDNVSVKEVLLDGTAAFISKGLYQSPYGVLVEGAATNLYPSPEAVATQTVSLALGDNVLSVYGTGSLATANGTGVATGHGTATEGTNVVLAVTTAGTFTFTLTGSLTKAQLEAGNVSSSFTATSRADSMGAIKWGTAAPAFGGNGFPHTRGNVMVAWQPQFNSVDLVASFRPVLSLDNGAYGVIYQHGASETYISTFDGTKADATAMPAWNRNDVILLNVRFGPSADPTQPAAQRLQLCYANATQGDTTFTLVASVPYDGAFNDTGFMQLLKALGGNNSVFGSITVNDTPATDAELNGLLA